MSKGEVLCDVYPDELEMLLERINEKKQKAEIKRLEGYINQFYAGGVFKSDSIESYWNDLIDRYNSLETGSRIENDTDPDSEDGIEKLKKLQGLIAKNQKQKKGGG